MTADPSATATQDPLSGTRWELDPAASTVEFRVPHFWGLISVKGRFERFQGSLERDARGQHQMILTIDAASLHTGLRQRDKHLRSSDFFDVEHHPTVRFRSTCVSDLVEDRVRVEGELDALGMQLTMAVEPTIHQTSERTDVELTTTIDQRQLGMTWSPLGMTKSPVTVTVRGALRPQA